MYNIRSVSQLVGIPAVTIRAWEMRYGVIVPDRSKGGHRLYSQQNIEDLLWLKKQLDVHGRSISQAAQSLKRQKNSKPIEQTQDTNLPQTEEFTLREELNRQLYELDAEKTHSILDRAFHTFSLQFVMHRLIAPFMVEVGDLWEAGKVSIAQEHFMSAIITQRISHYFRMFAHNSLYPKTVVLCPAGEHHQIGALMFSMFLRRHGIDVVFLGANTPVGGLDSLITDSGVERVVVSVGMEEAIQSANELIRKIHPLNEKLRFFVGGRNSNDPKIDSRYIKVGHYDADWEEVISRYWQVSKIRGQVNDYIG